MFCAGDDARLFLLFADAVAAAQAGATWIARSIFAAAHGQQPVALRPAPQSSGAEDQPQY
jgi:hypothetical protein